MCTTHVKVNLVNPTPYNLNFTLHCTPKYTINPIELMSPCEVLCERTGPALVSMAGGQTYCRAYSLCTSLKDLALYYSPVKCPLHSTVQFLVSSKTIQSLVKYLIFGGLNYLYTAEISRF